MSRASKRCIGHRGRRKDGRESAEGGRSRPGSCPSPFVGKPNASRELSLPIPLCNMPIASRELHLPLNGNADRVLGATPLPFVGMPIGPGSYPPPPAWKCRSRNGSFPLLFKEMLTASRELPFPLFCTRA